MEGFRVKLFFSLRPMKFLPDRILCIFSVVFFQLGPLIPKEPEQQLQRSGSIWELPVKFGAFPGWNPSDYVSRIMWGFHTAYQSVHNLTHTFQVLSCIPKCTTFLARGLWKSFRITFQFICISQSGPMHISQWNQWRMRGFSSTHSHTPFHLQASFTPCCSLLFKNS